MLAAENFEIQREKLEIARSHELHNTDAHEIRVVRYENG